MIPVSGQSRRVGQVAVAWLVLAGSVLVTSLLARPPQRGGGAHEPPLLPRKEVVLSVGAAYRHLVADYFWIQTLQATAKAWTPEQFRDIYDYAKLVIELDPDFRPVYGFAGGALPAQDKQGVWHNTRESTEFLEAGFRRFPDNVLLGILYAYNLSTFHKEFRKAADVLSQTARLPDAPSFLPALATRLYAQAGDFDLGLELATQVAESAEDPESKAVFERRVLQLKLERELKKVDAAIAEHVRLVGRPPRRVQELVDRGLLPRVPEDPFGGEILMGSDQRSYSSKERERLELRIDEGLQP